MKKPLDNSTLAIILYFISRLDGVLGKTHLQKLLFLSDLLAAKKFKAPITALTFKRYKHGPYAEAVTAYTENLIVGGFIEAREFPLVSDPMKKYTRFYLKKQLVVKDKVLELIGAEKLLIVDEVADSYGNMSLRNLLDIVYGLQEVKDAKMEQIFDLAHNVEQSDEEKDEDDFQF